MSKEIIILTQDTSFYLKENEMKDLEQQIKKKTGKITVVLPPGISWNTAVLKDQNDLTG